MYKRKKSIASFMCLIMIFSLVLNPFTAVFASGPTIKPGAPSLPGVPSVKPSAAASLAKSEVPSRLKGVNYKFKDEVKKLPTTFDYEFKTLTLDKFASTAADEEDSASAAQPPTKPAVNLPGVPGVTTPQGLSGQSGAGSKIGGDFDLTKISGIQYPAGSKILSVPKNKAASFSPEIREIYVDEEEGTAFRVLDTLEPDSEGNVQYVVETPELTEVFDSYSIPEQTVDLTLGNIAYIAPEFELSPESGMQKNYTAGLSDFISFKQVGNKHVLTFKPGVTIFEYPWSEDREAAKKEKEKAKKEKFAGDWWEKDQYSDLRGVEDESSLTVEIKVKEGTITVEDPKFHAYFDLNKWTTKVEADFYFSSKATADVTLEGELVFNKTIEKCVYGYDIDLGKVMGTEKGNKAFVGIFLVIGVEGKISVEVRTITTGDARAGFCYRAYGYGLIPYDVGPYATFKPSSFDMSFTVNGEINVTLACVPQVGIIIWGKELGVLQIWVGFKAGAKFSASGGGGSGGAQDFKASGSIELKAFGELVGYLLGSRYSIFYIDFPLYSGEWTVGEEVSGSGGDEVRIVPPIIQAKVDAYTNIVEGKVAFRTRSPQKAGYTGNEADVDPSLIPYAKGIVWIYVMDKEGKMKYERSAYTDANGCFSINPGNILPSDSVQIGVSVNYGPYFEINQQGFRADGKSKVIKPTVPFSELDFNVDAYNDVITGWVSGNYTGIVQVVIDGSTWEVRSDNGIFRMCYPIDSSVNSVTARIIFEGSTFGETTREPNLDALTINIFNEYKPLVGIKPRGQGAVEPDQGMTIEKGVDKEIPLPDAFQSFQDKMDDMASQSTGGRKLLRPSKVIGTISNKGAMGWSEGLGGDKFEVEGTTDADLVPFNGYVKIESIPVQTAVEHLLQINSAKIKGLPNQMPTNDFSIPWTETTQVQIAMMEEAVPDSSSPTGVRIKQIPTSAAKFEFERPRVVAYKVTLEHDGLQLTRIFNPFVSHCSSNGNNDPSVFEEVMKPVQNAITFVTQERVESVVNPADVMTQWQGSWVTNVGMMQLTQIGNAITGNIMIGKTILPVEGTISGGTFTGTYYDDAQTGVNKVVVFRMDISADGKTINFKNFDTGARIKGLTGTRATRQ